MMPTKAAEVHGVLTHISPMKGKYYEASSKRHIAYTVKMTTHLSKALEEDNEGLGGSRKTPNVRAKRFKKPKSNAFVEVLLLFYLVLYVVSSKDMPVAYYYRGC